MCPQRPLVTLLKDISLLWMCVSRHMQHISVNVCNQSLLAAGPLFHGMERIGPAGCSSHTRYS